jgi:hypothetical protein
VIRPWIGLNHSHLLHALPKRSGWFDPCGSHGSFQVDRKSKHTIGFGSVSFHLWTQSHLFSMFQDSFFGISILISHESMNSTPGNPSTQ